ncbi:MAG: hypothetical protein RLZZ582_502, partial [Verrucomicrobiota bacterium]
ALGCSPPRLSATQLPSATRCHASTVLGLSPVSRFSFMLTHAVPRWGTPKTHLFRASLRAKGRTCGAPKNRSGAGSDRSKHWKRSNPSPRAQRESRSSPELPCERRFGPAEPPKIAAERDRSDACIGSDQTLPLAHSAKTNPPPSLPACIGPVPRSPPSNSARFTQAVPLIPSPA